MDVLRRNSTPDGIPIVEAAALLEDGHYDVEAVELRAKNEVDTNGDNNNKIQQTDNCLAHVIELIGCRDEESFRSALNLTSEADLALLEFTDCRDLFPDDVLAKRRFWNMVTFVKNGNVITLNTTMTDIIQSNKKNAAQGAAGAFATVTLLMYICLWWFIFSRV
jgi:hypothetical protein